MAAASMEITGDEAGEGKAVQALREAFAVLSEGPERTTGALALGRRLAWLGETDEASQLLLDVLEGAQASPKSGARMHRPVGFSQVAAALSGLGGVSRTHG